MKVGYSSCPGMMLLSLGRLFLAASSSSRSLTCRTLGTFFATAGSTGRSGVKPPLAIPYDQAHIGTR